ncbi:MAG: ATP-binding protein [Solirubrobacteraceae bacterium]
MRTTVDAAFSGENGGVTTSPQDRRALTIAFDRVLRVVDGSRIGATVPDGAREDAHTHALGLLAACGGTSDGLTLATVGYAAELLGAIAVDLAAHPAESRRLVGELEARASVPRVALGRELLRGGRLEELTVETAVEVSLALLMAFTGAQEVSLWTLDGAGEPIQVAHTGATSGPDPRAPDTVRTVLGSRGRAPVVAGAAVGLRIDALRPPAAVLLAHGLDPDAPEPGPLLAAAAPLLAGALDRQTLRDRAQSQETAGGAVQRRLARLRFDLHDGPQQDVHLLAQDLRLFRDQLRPMIAGDADEARVLGRLDDLEAQLVALDGDLRRLSTSVQSPFLTANSLHDALGELAGAFAQRTGITPRTDFSGDLGALSDSQQIALLALVREALSNIRKHSNAESVTIAVRTEPDGIRVEISDDGSGFDPEATLVRAARAGRLGLVGMHERVRMLGGHTQIESRPGGPTLISAILPAWPGAQL